MESCEELYGIRLFYHNQVKMKHVKKLRKKLYALKDAEGIEFVHGVGKRKSLLQKSIETLEDASVPTQEKYIKIGGSNRADAVIRQGLRKYALF